MVMIKVPEKCLICEEEWQGGHAKPNDEMELHKRVFYKCGCSLSYSTLSEGVYKLLIKGCTNEEK